MLYIIRWQLNLVHQKTLIKNMYGWLWSKKWSETDRSKLYYTFSQFWFRKMFLIPLLEWFWHQNPKNPDTYATRNIFAYMGFQHASKIKENINHRWVRTGVEVLSSLVNLDWMHTTVFMGVSLLRLHTHKWLCQRTV